MSVARPVTRSVVRPVIRSVSGASGFSSMRADLTSTRLVRGVGSVTVPTIGDSDNDRYVLDFENIWRGVLAEEMRVYGARRVHNLIPAAGTGSASLAVAANKTMTLGAGTYIFSMGAGTGTATFSGTGGATGTLTANASSRTCVTKTITAGTLIVTASVASLVDLQVEDATGRSDTTTPSKYISVGVLSSPWHGANVDGVSYKLTTNGNTVTDNVVTEGVGEPIDSLANLVSNGDFSDGTVGWTSASADIAIVDGRLRVTNSAATFGRAYQAVTVKAGTEYTVIGTGETVQPGGWLLRVGTTPTGNDLVQEGTVGAVPKTASFVVPQGVTTIYVGLWNNFSTIGDYSEFDNVSIQRVPTIKGLLCEGEATELSGRSADIANWSTVATASVAQDETGLTGSPNEAFTVTDSSAIATQQRALDVSITSSSDTYFRDFWILYDASPSVYPAIYMDLKGATAVSVYAVVDPTTGVATKISGAGSILSSVRIGSFWKITLTTTDNGSGNNQSRGAFVPAYNADGSTTEDVSAQGSTVIAASCFYKDTSSYSPILSTGGTPKTRNSDTGYTLYVSNWIEGTNGEISLECELSPLFLAGTGSNQGIITPNSSNLAFGLYHGGANSSVIARDGTNAVSKTSVWSEVGQTVKVKMRAGVSGLNLSADKSPATEGSYDGTFNASGEIELFKDLTQGACIKNLHIYPTDLGNNWLEAS